MNTAYRPFEVKNPLLFVPLFAPAVRFRVVPAARSRTRMSEPTKVPDGLRYASVCKRMRSPFALTPKPSLPQKPPSGCPALSTLTSEIEPVCLSFRKTSRRPQFELPECPPA